MRRANDFARNDAAELDSIGNEELNRMAHQLFSLPLLSLAGLITQLRKHPPRTTALESPSFQRRRR
jgi:hypothetical protein